MGDGIERVTDLTAPPVVGQNYMVPTVRGLWRGRVRNWEVMGERHEDRKFFNFEIEHYHIDRRFLPRYLARDVEAAIRTPLTAKFNYGPDFPLGSVEWRIRVCRRHDFWPHADEKPVLALNAALSGAQCARNPAGWICPHRGFSLGSVAAVDGVVTCPLHGLRIVVKTGIVARDGAREGGDA